MLRVDFCAGEDVAFGACSRSAVSIRFFHRFHRTSLARIAASAVVFLLSTACQKTQPSPEVEAREAFGVPAVVACPPAAVDETSAIATPLERALVAFDVSFESGRYQEALACAQEAARLDPNEPAAHQGRALAFDALGRMHDAHVAYERMIALNPHDAESLRAASDFHLRTGGIDALETAILYARRGRESAESLSLGAELAAMEAEASNLLGRSEDALRASESALILDPNDPIGAVERAIALFELLRFDEARKAFEVVMSRSRPPPRAMHFAGLLHEREGRDVEAERLLREAHRLDPDAFPLLRVSPRRFRALVDEEIGGLSPANAALLGGTSLSIEELPSLDDLRAAMPVLSPTIVGLHRPAGSAGNSRDEIVLYRRNLLRSARTEDELRFEIRRTLLHELGHVAGETDDELRDRGI